MRARSHWKSCGTFCFSGQPISRILSVTPEAPLCSHLSGRRVAAPLVAAYPELAFPTKGKGAYGDEQPPVVHGRLRPCLALLPAGVTWPPALRQTPVVSYTTFSPSPLPSPEGRGKEVVCFCGPFPAGSRLSAVPRPGYSPTPCSIGVRTFLDSVNAEPRLPGQPEITLS